MATAALGPTMAGGAEPIVQDGYNLLYLPDVNNAELQREGQSPVFYWVPNQVRMARRDGPDAGDYLFNLIRFSGVVGEGVIGGGPDQEVAGGVLTFTVTGQSPEHVLRQSEQQIIERFQGTDNHYWGIRGNRPPLFRPAIVTSNITTISNVSPTPRGLPSISSTATRGGRSAVRTRGAMSRTLPVRATGRDAMRDSNLEPWYWRMQGEGNGTIDPSGQNAFSALLGAYPTAILWEGFHGVASPVVVIEAMKLKMWTPQIELHIRGNWDRVFEHFSAAAEAHYLWASVDVQAEFNNMRQSGTIEVDLKVDPTIPGGEEIARAIDERSNLIVEKFMEAARKVIFEPPAPTVEPAQASSGGGFFSPWGAGLALKYRRDETHLDLEYHEKRQVAHLQDHVVSSSLAGMYDEIKRDPDAERKYFLTVPLDDWPRKIARVCRPVVAWGDDAVEFVSVQLGYPNTAGELMWEGHSFGKESAEGADNTWKYAIGQKKLEEVSTPPAGWEPDKTFVKRKVHLAEPPSELEDPYTRIQIDKNVIDLDPEPSGTILNDTTLEVRADSAGRLAVGPLELGVALTDATQVVEVVMEPTDESGNPIGRPQVRFRWKMADYDAPRRWLIFTGDPAFRPFFRYQVEVTVKGTLFEDGKAWTGPWVATNGNGPLTINVPRADDPGVVTRALPSTFATADGPSTRGAAPGNGERVAAKATVLRGWPLSSGTRAGVHTG